MLSKREIKSSNVEKIWLLKSGRELIYPEHEHIGAIEVDNFPALGQLTALRFLEWAQENPGGVISLPTGKTPEHFIKIVIHYLKHWNSPATQKELGDNGVNPSQKPDMKSLHFVQIDEFYPIDPKQANSFYYYVTKYYIHGFGLDRNKALLIDTYQIGVPQDKKIADIFPDNVVDLSLRVRQAGNRMERLQKSVIDQVDQWCSDYETRIRQLGGIGFFLGGIGPDGHIAFNVRGSDHFTTTRLTPTNYETQAAAAIDLGGIEVARNRLVITIGLATLTYNKDAIAIIFAAGEAKARMVFDAMQQSKNILYPATVLHELPNARFYLTRGAARLLTERVYADIKNTSEMSDPVVEKVVIDLALEKKKRLTDLKEQDFTSIRSSGEVLARHNGDVAGITQRVRESLIAKIERGREDLTRTSFMHIGPHHDDIMLGYLGYIIHLVRPASNIHTFNYATSGFNAVTNMYVLNLLLKLKIWLDSEDCQKLMEQDYFNPGFQEGRSRDVFQYLDGIAAHSRSMKDEGECRRLLRILIFLFEENSINQLHNRIDELTNYFKTQYPGKKDLPFIQQLKGMIREWEADLIWGYFGFNTQSVNHLRMGFYKGDVFTELPEMERDVMPIYRLMEKQNPDVVSLAFDPEGSGPDTHFKVLQAITEALKLYGKKRPDVRIWGYRNVWFRFHPSDANIFVPVSLNSMAIMENAFMKCFSSQSTASFPSHEFDGPFCRLAQRIQEEQYQMMKICLGREFFGAHEVPRMRACHGLVFLREMLLDEFFKLSSELRKAVQNL